ncbi:MAG: TetR family transcriptional regulator [Desulfuromonadales bacterium C00003093]|nr:MAG: TetR family transcriptional regulator [Desulfuromonadales bacterium C00003093]
MRITKEAKEQNRIKILAVAKSLFSQKGYEHTTTRDISMACGMAKGTLFNYFKSKETLAMTMVADAMDTGRELYERRKSGEETFVEDLFLLVASELRALKPYRNYIGPVLESGMSVFSKTSPCEAGNKARNAHLNAVADILSAHGYESSNSSIVITLYWSLYLGILAHWSNDSSENQAETLTLVDFSMHMFTNTVAGNILSEHESICNEK